MMMTKRKPVSVDEILNEEFLHPLGLTQGDLAAAMEVPRKHVYELCKDRRAITAATASLALPVFLATAPIFGSTFNAVLIFGTL